LNPIDYNGPRWANRLLALDLGREPEPELIRFDLAVTISTMRYVSDLHRGRVNQRDFHFDLDINNKSLDFSGFLRAKLVNAPDVVAVMRRVEPPFPTYHQTVEALQTHMKMASLSRSLPSGNFCEASFPTVWLFCFVRLTLGGFLRCSGLYANRNCQRRNGI